jgi:hypothetical protein
MKGKLKAIIWVLFTPLAMLPGVLFALAEYDWGLKQYLYNARVYWYGGSYRDHEGRVFDKNDNQLYPVSHG